MRVFKFEKNSNYDISSKITPVKVENSQGFNYIIINNPGEANCLCIVNKFAVKTLESGNKAKLLISSHNGDSRNQMKLGSLDISCDLIEEECKGNIELDTIELQKEQELDLLERDFLIILPGGSLCVKLDNSVSDLEFSIGIGEEKIL